jgi:hypothetical protein
VGFPAQATGADGGAETPGVPGTAAARRYPATAVRRALISVLILAALAAGTASAADAPRWRAPEVVSSSDFAIAGLRAAADARGNALLIWAGALSGRTVLASERPAGGASWSAPQPIAEGCSATPLALAENARGDAVAAWGCVDLAPNAVAVRVQAARRPAGGAWEAAQTLSTVMPGPFANLEFTVRLDVGVAVNGDAALVWSQAGQGVQGADLPRSGSAWTPPVALDPVPGLVASDVDLALRPDGSAAAAWQQGGVGGRSVVVAERPSGGAWSAPATVSTGANAYYPALAVAGDGTVVAAWTDGDGGPHVVARARPPGGAWSPPAALGPGYAPRVDGTAGAGALVTWVGGAYPHQTLSGAVRRAGGEWRHAGDLPGGPAGLPRSWDVAVRADGSAMVMGITRAPAAYVAALGPDGRFTPPFVLSNPATVRAGWAAVAALPAGEAAAAWAGSVPEGALGRPRGGDALQASTLARGSTRPPLASASRLGRLSAFPARVPSRALLRLTPSFERYAGPVAVVVQRRFGATWRQVARGTADADVPLLVRLGTPGAADLRMAYGPRTSSTVRVRVTMPGQPRVPAGLVPRDLAVGAGVLWSISGEADGSTGLRGFDARDGRLLRGPVRISPDSRLVPVGGRVWLTRDGRAQVETLDVTAADGRRGSLTLPASPLAISSRGGVAWMVSACLPADGCSLQALRRVDVATGAALTAPVPVAGPFVALGPDALWTARPLPCPAPDCEAPPWEAERRDPVSGQLVEAGGQIGELLAPHGSPPGQLVATPGGVVVLSCFGGLVRRDAGGAVSAMGQGFGYVAADDRRVLAVGGPAGGLTSFDAVTGALVGTVPVGPNASVSTLAIAPAAIWAAAPREGTLIRLPPAG